MKFIKAYAANLTEKILTGILENQLFYFVLSRMTGGNI